MNRSLYLHFMELWALIVGKDRMIKLLVSKGCDLYGKDYEGRTALDWAQMMNFHVETQTLRGIY